jgi:bilirubin oxidase
MKLFSYIIAFNAILIGAVSAQKNPLLIPDTIQGKTFKLNLQKGEHTFFKGVKTSTYGVNGNILGPTLIFKKGDSISLIVNNKLADSTTIHWHGLHVSPENDGGPHTVIAPGTAWNPKFKVRDHAATYWYHPHLHSKTNEHVSKGLAGLIIVKDDAEKALNLPRTYGIDDIPLVLQTKDFDDNKEILVHTNSDDIAMVNATIDAEYDMPAQIVRLRLLNGSSQRAFNIGFTNNIKFFQIASDGGLLDKPVELTRLLLAPGERAEILIDLKDYENKTVELKSYSSELPNGIYGATNPGMSTMMTMSGYSPNPLNGADYTLLSINVKSAVTGAIDKIPTDLVKNTIWNESDVDVTRSLTFTPQSMGRDQLNGKFLINNSSFDMNTINYKIPFDNTEIWEIRNQSGISHPFHIHDVQFYILTRNGVKPAENERYRKDVVLIRPNETIRFITKFETFANSKVPYMYHCHLLTHEDDGMMGQFVVEKSPLYVDSSPTDDFTVYPNPVNDILNFSTDDNIQSTTIYDANGHRLSVDLTGLKKIDLSELNNGIYLIEIRTNKSVYFKHIVVAELD